MLLHPFRERWVHGAENGCLILLVFLAAMTLPQLSHQKYVKENFLSYSKIITRFGSTDPIWRGSVIEGLQFVCAVMPIFLFILWSMNAARRFLLARRSRRKKVEGERPEQKEMGEEMGVNLVLV